MNRGTKWLKSLAVALLVLGLSACPALAADNTSIATATPIAMGQTIQAQFEQAITSYYYQITLEEPTYAYIQTVCDGFYSSGRTYNANGQLESQLSFDTKKRLLFPKGKSYVSVSSGTVGRYSLILTPCAMATAVSIESAPTGELAPYTSYVVKVAGTPSVNDDYIDRWTTTNSKVAYLERGYNANEMRLVTRQGGTATVTVIMLGGAQGSLTVTVAEPELIALIIASKERGQGTIGYSYPAPTVTAFPDGASLPDDLVWSSANPAVVSVDPQTGRFTCNALGSAYLTVTSPSHNRSTNHQITVVPNALVRSSPLRYEDSLVSCARRLYYKGKYLYVEVYLSNQTEYKIAPKGSLGLAVYDYALSDTKPAYKAKISWKPGTLKSGKYKVYKTRLPKGKLLSRNLADKQLEAVVYGKFTAKKATLVKSLELQGKRTGSR